ncbi:hypothetical protein Acr_07g0016870 [Actinidia rufa]|uniref:Anther-specific protein BCP1 n=1 Tax=Actinidia rufa TaxID=165716 RepID=A0A7J0EYH4_9ERIC|nr:hypothetical protein Acr_07g0016870 [Actinidia rufa]
MACKVLVLALLFLTMVGLAAADVNANANTLTANDDSGTIGNIDGGSDAAPVGGPVPAGVFTTVTTTDAPAPSPKGGAAALEVSVVAGFAAAIAVVFF